MRSLHRKLLRDLWRMRGQVATITLVLGAGLAAYLSLSGTYRALEASRDRYYATYGFPEVFVHLERAPDRVADELATLPGVASVETRLVEPLLFRIPGVPRPPAGRAVSLPARDAAGLRSLALRQGRTLEPGRRDEALLLETFAEAHGIEPGDELDVVIDRREVRLRIVGLVLSPEWIFPAEAGAVGEAGFGVVWMDRDALAALTGKRGAFDDATFALEPGADPAATIAAIDRALDRWGGQHAYARARQGSHRALTGELDQLSVLATQVPVLFLGVAAFLLNVVLGRIVHLQREQLAVLRAVGYSRASLGWHIVGFASVIVVGGCVIGIALGTWLAGKLVALYGGFFHFPVLEIPFDAGLTAIGIAAVVVAGGIGALGAAWRAVRLAPAEAMRPPVPARYREGWLSRLGLARLAGRMGKMIVRDVERRPVSTGIAVLGLACALAIVVLGRFSVDSFQYLLDVVMARSNREDVAVTLARPLPQSALASFRHAPGVLAAEPARTIPVRLVVGHRHYDTTITGLPRDARLRQILDAEARPVDVPPHGLMLTELLAARLGAAPGDPITVERLDGDHRTLTIPLAATVDERLGMNAYMELRELARVLGEAPSMSTVLLEVDEPERDRLLAWLTDVPGVVMVVEPRTMRDAFYAQTGETMLVWALIVVVFGSVIAVGVVYNTARIALSERSRDLATLRVLGFTGDEVATVLLGQLAIQVIVAVPIGILGGHLLANLFMSQVDPEQFRFPAVVSPATFTFSSLVVVGAAIATAIVVRHKLDRLDLVSALKARD